MALDQLPAGRSRHGNRHGASRRGLQRGQPEALPPGAQQVHVGGLVEPGQVLHGEAAADAHLEARRELDPVQQAQRLQVVQHAVAVQIAPARRVARVAVQVQHDIVEAAVGGEQPHHVQGARQQLAGLVAGVGQDEEAAAVAQRSLGRLPVRRRREDLHVDPVGHVAGVNPAGPRDVTAPLAHGQRYVGHPEQLRPADRQHPLWSGPVDRVVVDPARPGGVQERLHLRVGEEAHPPDIGQADHEVRADPHQVGQHHVGPEGVVAHRVHRDVLPPGGAAVRLPTQDLDPVTAVAQPPADLPGHRTETAWCRGAVRDPQDPHAGPLTSAHGGCRSVQTP